MKPKARKVRLMSAKKTKAKRVTPQKRDSDFPKIGCVQHDCAECRSMAKRLKLAVMYLQNAEPLIRGHRGAPIALAHQNIADALGALNVPVSVPVQVSAQRHRDDN